MPTIIQNRQEFLYYANDSANIVDGKVVGDIEVTKPINFEESDALITFGAGAKVTCSGEGGFYMQQTNQPKLAFDGGTKREDRIVLVNLNLVMATGFTPWNDVSLVSLMRNVDVTNMTVTLNGDLCTFNDKCGIIREINNVSFGDIDIYGPDTSFVFPGSSDASGIIGFEATKVRFKGDLHFDMKNLVVIATGSAGQTDAGVIIKKAKNARFVPSEDLPWSDISFDIGEHLVFMRPQGGEDNAEFSLFDKITQSSSNITNPINVVIKAGKSIVMPNNADVVSMSDQDRIKALFVSKAPSAYRAMVDTHVTGTLDAPVIHIGRRADMPGFAQYATQSGLYDHTPFSLDKLSVQTYDDYLASLPPAPVPVAPSSSMQGVKTDTGATKRRPEPLVASFEKKVGEIEAARDARFSSHPLHFTRATLKVG